MSHERIAGEDFSLDNRTIRFFDMEGFVLSPTCWSLRHIPGEAERTTPVSTLAVIRGLLSDAAARNVTHNVRGVMLNPQMAVGLFLEGALTSEHLSVTTERSGIVFAHQIIVDGHRLYVVVMEYLDPGVMLIEAGSLHDTV